MTSLSVIIPLFNKENDIVDTLTSVYNQTFDDFEIIRGHAKLHILDLEKIDNKIVSSTLLKLLMEDNALESIKELLNFNYLYKGPVIYGLRRGTEIGFPTANIQFPEKTKQPSEGIYASYITVKGKRYKSITSISTNPTFEDDEMKFETHIFNFKKIIYDEMVYVELVSFIRKPIKFDSKEDLVIEIKKDIEKVNKYFSNNK